MCVINFIQCKLLNIAICFVVCNNAKVTYFTNNLNNNIDNGYYIISISNKCVFFDLNYL